MCEFLALLDFSLAELWFLFLVLIQGSCFLATYTWSYIKHNINTYQALQHLFFFVNNLFHFSTHPQFVSLWNLSFSAILNGKVLSLSESSTDTYYSSLSPLKSDWLKATCVVEWGLLGWQCSTVVRELGFRPQSCGLDSQLGCCHCTLQQGIYHEQCQ